MAVTHNLTREEAAQRSRLLRVDSYDVSLDLVANPAAFHSRTEVRFSCSRPGADSFIELAADSIGQAILNGQPIDVANYSSADGLVLTGLAAENTLVIDADIPFSRDGEGLHRLVDPADGESYVYTHFEANNAQKVFACFDQPDLKARFTLRAKVPENWHAVSNMPVAAVDVDGTAKTVQFAELPTTSTYLTALCAGPFHSVFDSHDGIDLGLYCRASMKDHLESTELFELTKAGLDHFHDNFGVRYPLPKYDQVAMPEYNSGATENFGCVVFAERLFVFSSEVTDAERQRRAYVLYHEMAHMWFGDLVTPQWWDEVWLKESFATWAGNWALTEATRFTGAWTSFQAGEKNLGYRADQLPTTHPIHAEVSDVKIGRSNFDAITYLKGASVLRQLVAYVGIEPFLAGLRDYFAAHQWSTANFGDLRRALENASGRDLSTWSAAWLNTTGHNTLHPKFTVSDDDTYASFAIRQTAADPTGTIRPHRIAVGLYDLVDGTLQRRHRTELDLTDEQVEVPELIGMSRADVLLLNDDDLSFARIRLDPRSLSTVMSRLADFDTSLPRALSWSTAWEMLREGELPAADFLTLIADQLPAEDHDATTAMVLMLGGLTLRTYVPTDRLADAHALLARAALTTVATATPGSGHQLAWAREYADHARSDIDVDRLRGWLTGYQVPEGLSVDPQLRWHILAGLGAADALSDADINAEIERDTTLEGKQSAMRIRAIRPTAEAKAWAWERLSDPALANTDQRAVVSGFLFPGQEKLLSTYVAPYLDLVTRLWDSGLQERGMALAGSASGLPVATETVAAFDEWLADPSRPATQRRAIVEARAEILRGIRVRAKQL